MLFGMLLLGGVAPSVPAAALPNDTGAAAQHCLLSLLDVRRYRRVAALQQAGRWPAAEMLLGQVESDLLLGWVLAQRYLHSDYVVTYQELVAWLERYGDHPDASALHRLALTIRPVSPEVKAKGEAAEEKSEGDDEAVVPVEELPPLPEPQPVRSALLNEPPLFPITPYRSTKARSREGELRVRALKQEIGNHLRNTRLSQTEALLQSAEVVELFDLFELDESRYRLAAAWFHQGESERALEIVSAVTERSGEQLPLSHWTAGLAAWRLGQVERALHHFERYADAEQLPSWNRAAGGYWSARAHFAQGNWVDARLRLVQAAQYDRTFYGILAAGRLGWPLTVTLRREMAGCEEIAPLLESPAGQRAVALVQIGQAAAAVAELQRVPQWRKRSTVTAMLALAHQGGLYHFGLRLAERLTTMEPELLARLRIDLDPFLYPLPLLQSHEALRVDRALLYAFMRQESGFDPQAGSHRGAMGLMQLLPRTAASLDPERQFTGEERTLLYDPVLNVTLGQRYLQELLGSRRVAQDLFRLSVAYNAGLGNLAKWEAVMVYGDDPLLFIESLPARETRLFVERVIANLWVYRAGMGQTSPSLATLGRDQWPRYHPLDRTPETALVALTE